MSEPSRLDALSQELYGAPQGYQPAVGPGATHAVDIVTRPSSGPPVQAPSSRLDTLSQELYGTAAPPQAGTLSMMPGFEFMHLLPQASQEAVAAELPGVARGVAATGVSTATSLGGAALGGAVAGPPGALGGEMVGSLAGRRINVALGLEDPSLGADIAAAGGPLLSRVVSLAGRVARGVRPPAAQEIVELGEHHGVRTSYADVTQGPMARRIETLLESVPLLGTSRFRAGQQADVRAAADTVADAARVAMEQTPYSGIAATQRAAAQGHAGARNALQAANNAGDDWTRIVQASGNLKALRARQTAEQLYDRVEQLAAGSGAGPLTNTLDALQTASQQVGEAIIPDPQLTGVLRTLQDSLTNPQAQLAFSNIRQLRSDLGDIISDYYKNTNAIVGKKGVGHLTTIREAVEQDLEAFALSSGNPELIAAWKRADRFYRQEVVPFKDPQLAKALRNTHPDEVYGKFIQRDKGDRAMQFYKALDAKGRAAVRYGMVQEAITDATQTTTGAFSPAKFAGSLERLQDARGVFFRGQEKWELDGFVKLMRHVERAGQYAENPPTGQRLIHALVLGGAGAGAMLSPQTVVGGGAISAGLTWLLTSERGRNLLLAASDLGPGSPAMGRIAEAISREAARIGGPALTEPEAVAGTP